MLKFKKGDIITAFKNEEFEYLCHQTNCKNIHGAGIAKKLVDEFPDLRKAGSMWKPLERYGRSAFYSTSYGSIVNIYAQFNPGCCSQIVSGADSFEYRCKKLKSALEHFKNRILKEARIGMPLIASGLAADIERKRRAVSDILLENGDQEKFKTDLEYFQQYIQPIIADVLDDYNVTIYHL